MLVMLVPYTVQVIMVCKLKPLDVNVKQYGDIIPYGNMHAKTNILRNYYYYQNYYYLIEGNNNNVIIPTACILHFSKMRPGTNFLYFKAGTFRFLVKRAVYGLHVHCLGKLAINLVKKHEVVRRAPAPLGLYAWPILSEYFAT